MSRIAVLIIATDDTNLYIQLQDCWRERIKAHPNIDCYFIKCDPLLDNKVELIDDTIYVNCIEDIHYGILFKTLSSIRYVLSDSNPLNNSVDYVIRTNLSSFYNMNRLYEYVMNLPKTGAYHAIEGNHHGYRFGSGCGFIMSKDVAKLLAQANIQDLFNPQIRWDDVCIGTYLHLQGVRITGSKRLDITSMDDVNQIHTIIHKMNTDKEQHHIRIKIPDREKEPQIQRLLNQLYNPGRKIAITFASNNMKGTLTRFEKELRDSKLFDEVHALSEDDFDEEFKKEHLEWVKQNPRGFGFWLWKPYFIQRFLKSLQYGDILVYADAGCTLSSVQGLQGLMERCVYSPFGIFANPNCIVQDFTKMDTYYGCEVNPDEYKHKWMIEAGRQIIHKRKNTEYLINKWWEVCTKQNYHYIDDSPSLLPNLPQFQDHRHDQSIYTLLFHKHGGHPISYEGIIDATRLRY